MVKYYFCYRSNSVTYSGTCSYVFWVFTYNKWFQNRHILSGIFIQAVFILLQSDMVLCIFKHTTLSYDCLLQFAFKQCPRSAQTPQKQLSGCLKNLGAINFDLAIRLKQFFPTRSVELETKLRIFLILHRSRYQTNKNNIPPTQYGISKGYSHEK